MTFYYGHASEWIDLEDGSDELRYTDTGESCWTTPTRPCPKCGEVPGGDNHDPCMQNLPGVEYACCGHGVEEGYIKFEDGRTFRFSDMHVSISKPHPLMLKKAREG